MYQIAPVSNGMTPSTSGHHSLHWHKNCGCLDTAVRVSWDRSKYIPCSRSPMCGWKLPCTQAWEQGTKLQCEETLRLSTLSQFPARHRLRCMSTNTAPATYRLFTQNLQTTDVEMLCGQDNEQPEYPPCDKRLAISHQTAFESTQ